MNTEPNIGKIAKRIAYRKIVWYCCPSHDGWAFTSKMKTRFNRIARRRTNRSIEID